MANRASIITDAFLVNEHSKAFGINMVASCPGSYRAFSGRHTGNLQLAICLSCKSHLPYLVTDLKARLFENLKNILEFLFGRVS